MTPPMLVRLSPGIDNDFTCHFPLGPRWDVRFSNSIPFEAPMWGAKDTKHSTISFVER